MTRWIAFVGILLFGVAAVVVSERRKVEVPASPAALLYLVADTEQELARMPVAFTRMPDEEEIRIGDELARRFAAQLGQEDIAEVNVVEHYLTRVGRELASRAHRELPYKFHYIADSNFINAFALPGGHVYVGAGLLALMDTEDELAAVVGHEIEHIDHYHCADRVQQQEALRKLPLGVLLELPIELFVVGYSKDQELEADREGTRLAVQAGYSANGAVRMFETFDRLHKEYQAKAKTPQDEISQLAQQTLEGYFRSHPLPAERIAQVQRMIASDGWSPRAERDLGVAYIFRTDKARKALEAGRYGEAEQLANQSLHLRPDQPRALQVLALAQFAQADFSGAAAAYRKLLEIDPSHAEIVSFYAQALAAADGKSAAQEFRRWTESTAGQKPREVQVAEAGLNLLAGDSGAAHRLESELRQSGEAQAPIWIGELGWWYYLNADYQNAIALLSEAQQQRPTDLSLALRLGWAKIEVRRYADALQILEGFSYDRQMPPEKAIVRAVIHWQAQQHDEALNDFAMAVKGQPQWENSNWVNALYSPLIEQSIQQMEAERERRKLLRAKAVAHP